MPNFEVDYSYKIEEYATNPVSADSVEHAETLTRDYVRDTFTSVSDIQIDAVREVAKA